MLSASAHRASRLRAQRARTLTPPGLGARPVDSGPVRAQPSPPAGGSTDTGNVIQILGSATDFSEQELRALYATGAQLEFVGSNSVDDNASDNADSDAATDAGALRMQRIEAQIAAVAAAVQHLTTGSEAGTGDDDENQQQSNASSAAAHLAAQAVHQSMFQPSVKLHSSIEAAAISAVRLAGAEFNSVKARSIKHKLKYAAACEDLVVVVEHAAVYVQTADKRSPYRAEHATPELVYDLTMGSQRLTCQKILERLAGQEDFGRACFIKGLAVTSVIGAKALGEFLSVARDEYDYLTANGTWDDPSMRDAYLLALNRNFASYGALVRGVRSEQSFEGTEAFTGDMDYRLMTVAVEAKQSQRPAVPDDPDDTEGDRGAELQRVHDNKVKA